MNFPISNPPGLEKIRSGIAGLDEITGGGLPRGRATLICGGAGCGKTLFGLMFLLRGAIDNGEPGVFMAFEEGAEDLAKNIRSLDYDLAQLIDAKQVVVDHVRVDRAEFEETGEYDLGGLFIRLGHAIDSIGARRVVLDTMESLFSDLTNTAILRAEFRRLFRWLKDKGVTVVITAERGKESLTRHGLEEYISDCVVVLDHRVNDQIATRFLRVVKYRGSFHATNEYPFLINESGVQVQPITSVGLDHQVSDDRVSSGVGALDAMLGGKGYFRGSSVLISGTAGTGKSTLAATFVDAACRRGERALFFAFEEPKSQIIRNMRSIDLDLERHVQDGRLEFHALRPTMQGLELHLSMMSRAIREFQPHLVVTDPISNFTSVGSSEAVKCWLIRLVDELKSLQITTLFTCLLHGGDSVELTNVGISSLADTWLSLRDLEVNGERNRVLHVLKSRGMPHSNQVREFRITDRGVELVEAYLGPHGVLTGSARLAQEAKEKAEAQTSQRETELKRRAIERRRKSIEAQLAALTSTLEEQDELLRSLAEEENSRAREVTHDRAEMATSRNVVTNQP